MSKNASFIGPFQNGKSTLIGHILFEHKNIENYKIVRHKYHAKKAHGCNRNFFPFIVDKTRFEKNKNLTTTIYTFYLDFYNSMFTIVNTPGRRKYMHNMIAAVSQANMIIFVLSAKKPEFEQNATSKGQILEQLIIVYSMGFRRLIVAVSKMDATPDSPWSQTRFKQICEKTKAVAKKTGFNPKHVTFVPVSGLTGDNISKKSENMDWYDGPTLLQAMDGFEKPVITGVRPLRLSLIFSDKIGGLGQVVRGKVLSGQLRPQMKVTLNPIGLTTTVESIEMTKRPVDQGNVGDFVGFHVNGLHRRLRVGSLVVTEASQGPLAQVVSFVAKVMILHCPRPIKKNHQAVLYCHTAKVGCRFEHYSEKVNRTTGELLEQEPDWVEQGNSVKIVIVPLKNVVVEVYSEYPALGRIILEDMGRVMGVGVITKVN